MRTAVVGVAVLAWLLFSASFLLRAVTVTDVDVMGWPFELEFSGWQAAVLALGALDELRRDPLWAIVNFLGALGNIVMLCSPWVLFRDRGVLIRVLPMIVLVA